MIEVTKNNFDSVLPRFEKELKNCSYVSIDCEFSYLPTDDDLNSLFDYGEQRYYKLRKHLRDSIPLQVGISLFTFMRDLKKYDASIYRFFVIPRPFGPIIKGMSFKTSTIQFLCNNKFDFSKCFYEGLSYLNKSEETLIRKMLTRGCLMDSIDNALDYSDVGNVLSHGSAIAAWLTTSSPGDAYDISIDNNDISYRYFIHKDIRQRFLNTWTYISEDNCKIIVKHVSAEDRKMCEVNEKDPANVDNLIDDLLGFTKVFRLLTEVKKPFVGHNLILDLLIMYHQFHQDLPDNYTAFKDDLHKLLPQIYDTKVMAFEIQKSLSKVFLHDMSLGKLYSLFQNKDGVIYQPQIVLASSSLAKDEEQRLHDAGWDSYFTGFCFIKLAHFWMNSQNSSNFVRIITFKEILHSVSFLANKIGIARASIPYMNLSGSDPPSTRPPVLHVSWKNGKSVEYQEIDALFDKYGLFSIKEYYNSVLLATANYGSYKDILKDFNRHKHLNVERFSLFRHHKGLRIAFCLGGFILPICLAVWYKKSMI